MRPLSSGFLRRRVAGLVPALVIIPGVIVPSAIGNPDRAVTAIGGVVDPVCKGGAGVITLPPSWLADGPTAVTAMLPHGITLVVVSSGYPASSYALVHAFTSACVPDPSFGDKGTEHLVLDGRAFSIAAAVPATDGGAILVGGLAGGWLVAHMEPSGRLDKAFGKGGWTVLPWRGDVSAVAQAPSGMIVLGGSLGIANSPEGVSEVSGHGTLSKGFGRDGLVEVPTDRDDSELAQVAFEGSGDILALTLGGNMGVWGVTVNALRPNGSPVPSFKRDFQGAIGRASPQVLVADLVVRRGGFFLLGTRQSVPVGVPSSTATGQVIAFEPDGSLDTSFASGGQERFSCPLGDPVWALPQQGGGTLMVAETPPTEASATEHVRLDLVGISKDGKVEPMYIHGPKQLQLPFLGGSYPASAIPVSIATNGKVSVVVSSTADGKALKLVQLLG